MKYEWYLVIATDKDGKVVEGETFYTTDATDAIRAFLAIHENRDFKIAEAMPVDDLVKLWRNQ